MSDNMKCKQCGGPIPPSFPRAVYGYCSWDCIKERRHDLAFEDGMERMSEPQ